MINSKEPLESGVTLAFSICKAASLSVFITSKISRKTSDSASVSLDSSPRQSRSRRCRRPEYGAGPKKLLDRTKLPMDRNESGHA